MDFLTERAITCLRRDGRASYSTIAKELGTSRANVSTRLSPLFKSGSLRVIAAIHPRVLGLKVLAHLSLRVSGDPSGVVERLSKLPSAVYLSEATGTYQVIVELHSPNLAELHRDVGEIRTYPGVLEGHVLQYEHVYSSFFLGEEPALEGFQLDETNVLLAQQLKVDGRKSYAELAENAGLSISAARDRVTRLLEAGAMQIGVVRGRNSTGTELVFGFGMTTSGERTRLLDLLRDQPGLEFLSTTVGRYDLVTTISFNSLPQFTELLQAVRSLSDVHSIETWLHTRIHLERYVHSGSWAGGARSE